MRRILDHRPSAAMVVAVVALIVALGGGAYAAIKLPTNSVGSKQLKNNAVTSQKVKDRSLLATDFKSGQLPRGAQGLQGLQGPQGVKGDPGAVGQQGAKGDTGPSDVYEADDNVFSAGHKQLTLTVPAGSYEVLAKARTWDSGAATSSNCILSPSDGFTEIATQNVVANGWATLVAATADRFSATATISYACSGDPQLEWADIRILATKVGAVH